jgi:hypothetical protein
MSRQKLPVTIAPAPEAIDVMGLQPLSMNITRKSIQPNPR